MSTEQSALERILSNQLVAISVSDSPDLARLGMLERSLRQTVSALTTRLVRYGARIAYGGNLDQNGYTYQLYPTIAQAYATAALRASCPPFVHYLAAYLTQDPAEVAAHLKAVGGFAEVRLVDSDREVTNVVMSGNDFICRSSKREFRIENTKDLTAFVADLPRRSAGRAADLDAMRIAMEDDVTSRIIIGGRVAGYGGSKPGILQETLLALQKNHAVYPLGGFGGSARDAAIALGLLSRKDALDHEETGPGYQETVEAIRKFAGDFRERAKVNDAWDDLVAASKAEDPEDASKHVMRAFVHRERRSVIRPATRTS